MKNIFLSLIFIMICCITQFAIADNKVVIIPLTKSSIITQDKYVYGGGKITSDGKIWYHFGKEFTIRREGTGRYWVDLIGISPNCEGPWPVPMLSLLELGFITNPLWWNDCTNGDMKLLIETTDTSGVKDDLTFNIAIFLADEQNNVLPTSSKQNANNPEHCEYITKTQIMTCQ